jgi:hypothetical protein
MSPRYSKFFAMFLALPMFFLIAAPANARSKHGRKHGKHVPAKHQVTKHKAPKHTA